MDDTFSLMVFIRSPACFGYTLAMNWVAIGAKMQRNVTAMPDPFEPGPSLSALR